MILFPKTGTTSSLSLSAIIPRDFNCFKKLIPKWLNFSKFATIISLVILCGPFLTSLSAQVLPKLTLSVADTNKPGDVTAALQILFLVTILALAPSILIMMTSFVRIIIVLSFLRRAIGTQTMPPDQIMAVSYTHLTLPTNREV